MNHFSPGEAQGYAETWQAYTHTPIYKKHVRELMLKGINKDYIDTILEHAFNAGWSLLVSTFIKNITENEKRRDKKAHLHHELAK